MELPGGRKGAGGGSSGGGGGDKKLASKAPPAAEAPTKSSVKKPQTSASKVPTEHCTFFFFFLNRNFEIYLSVQDSCTSSVFCVFVQPSAGASKKSKPTSAAGGKPKKTPDIKELTESELSVSLSAYILSKGVS